MIFFFFLRLLGKRGDLTLEKCLGRYSKLLNMKERGHQRNSVKNQSRRSDHRYSGSSNTHIFNYSPDWLKQFIYHGVIFSSSSEVHSASTLFNIVILKEINGISLHLCSNAVTLETVQLEFR